MKHAVKNVVVLSGSLLLLVTAAGTASANYTGYGDGAPGPADIWAASHPDFGKVMDSRMSRVTHARNPHHATRHSS